MEREGPSYTYDTIMYLSKKYNGALGTLNQALQSKDARSPLEGKIGLIIGDDLLESFSQWYKHDELPLVADIILARRGKNAASALFTFVELKNSLLDISSTDIRNRIQNGLSWRYLAGEGVSQYIKKEKLYGCTDF
jgi:nicotinate-nucleotide adenylyltransferase